MAELKTKPNHKNVNEFIDSIGDADKRHNSQFISDLMQEIIGAEPKMWGDSIVGFGSYHYKYESGREGDWFLCGFLPRKQDLTLYIMPDLSKHNKLLNRLGKFKTGKSCLYIKNIDDINLSVLKELISRSIRDIQKMRT